MPSFQIYQQSILGDIVKFPYYVLKFMLSSIVKLVFLPYRLIKFLARSFLQFVSWALPDIYEDNLLHSLKAFFCISKFVFLLFTLIFIVLFPLHLLPLLGAHGILGQTFAYHYDLPQALILLVKTFAVTEGIILIVSLLGFLLSSLLATLFISTYSPLKVIAEFVDEATGSQLLLILTCIAALLVFGVLSLVVTGKIPI